MNINTCMQEVHKLTVFLILLIKWNEIDDDDERLLNAEFAVEEEELKYYTGLA